MAIALFVIANAIQYPIGDLAHAGPGMFPLIVSGILLVLASISVLQSRFLKAVPFSFNVKNIGLLLSSLIGFVVSSHFVNALLGIFVMVFIAGSVAATYSWKRNLQIAIGLAIVALAFQEILGLHLGLI
ncbi:tripartite tricarboxylate transporter TctB family protein [Azospirillum sp. TSH100]|nr:tripartite tricarboxylate transporter TctB family protein [Azospirillum sp. TSH100]